MIALSGRATCPGFGVARPGMVECQFQRATAALLVAEPQLWRATAALRQELIWISGQETAELAVGSGAEMAVSCRPGQPCRFQKNRSATGICAPGIASGETVSPIRRTSFVW